MREAILCVLLATAAFSVAPASAVVPPLVVAVLDTGIDPSHPEFAPGQVVAWWDFTADKGQGIALPGPGDVMDPRFAPYDWHGHGTATASLVGGANTADGVADCGKTSYAPGVALAIAKVVDLDEAVEPLAPAIRWAVAEAGADVISISISSFVPVPGVLDGADEAIEEARAAGVLVVVSAGNGVLDLGALPFPSEAGLYGLSPSALVVGSSGRLGPSLSLTDNGNLDPELVAWSQAACVAAAGSTGYVQMTGTSFSAPLVAGAAASVIAEARATGQLDDAGRVETILKHAATDSLLPYAKEGWGFVSDGEVAAARAAAAAGTLPAHPCVVTPCTDPLYEAFVADTARLGWDLVDDETLDDVGVGLDLIGLHIYFELPRNGAGTIEASTPIASEVEVYAVPLLVGQQGDVTLTYIDEVVAVPVADTGLALGEDVDLWIYVPGALDDGILEADERLCCVALGAGEDETAEWTADVDGTYLAVVYGWSAARPVHVAVGGATFLEEGVFLGQSILT